MNRQLNREILRLSVPSILANLTVPLVGMVDTAVAGHLHGGNAATFIGAISIGAMLFNLLYWGFGFLRTGTGGLTAQAFGRNDMQDSLKILVRGVCLALGISILLLVLQWPFVKLVLSLMEASPGARTLAEEYFFIRIWAAPATLCLMVFSGWFAGMQDSMSSMWKDLVVNGVNVVASIILATGAGNWKGFGFAGIAMGTVAAQYSGLAFCVIVCLVKYRRKVFSLFKPSGIPGMLRGDDLGSFFKMNLDLLIRSLGFIVIYIGYTAIAAGFGDTILACSSIMMQMLMIFSYFTDGFAYAGEALSGRFIGEGNTGLLRRSVRYVFVWSMSVSVLFIGIYVAGGVPLLKLLTSDTKVVESCREFLPWLILMPPIGCAAFTWDGIFMGATASVPFRNSMVGAAIFFFGTWTVCRAAFTPSGAEALHCLLAAYFAHLLFRTVYLSLSYRACVLTSNTGCRQHAARFLPHRRRS